MRKWIQQWTGAFKWTNINELKWSPSLLLRKILTFLHFCRFFGMMSVWRHRQVLGYGWMMWHWQGSDMAVRWWQGTGTKGWSGGNVAQQQRQGGWRHRRRCGADVTKARVVSGFGRTTFTLKWFQGRGLRHTLEGDTWQEYGRKTAKLEDVNPRAVGTWKDPPTVDLGQAKSDGWQDV